MVDVAVESKGSNVMSHVLVQQPWLISPFAFVVATIIAFNFVGDGLRDAADPFSR